MNHNPICIPSCVKVVLPELKPKWQRWLLVSLVNYQIDGTLPKFPSRLNNVAKLSWKMIKSYIDYMASSQQDANKTELYDDLTNDVVDANGCKKCKQKSSIAKKQRVEDCKDDVVDAKGCKKCKQKNSTAKKQRDENCKDDVVDVKGCKKCKQKSMTVKNEECADYEAVSNLCAAGVEKNGTSEDEFRAKGCKNCKQKEITGVQEVVYEEEKKKTKKRNSPCTPYRKENKKRKEEVFPLYPPKGERKKENCNFEEVVDVIAISATEVKPNVKCEELNLPPPKYAD